MHTQIHFILQRFFSLLRKSETLGGGHIIRVDTHCSCLINIG